MSRVMITVPNELLSEIDQVAQIEHRSRSELIREAMRQYLKQSGGKPSKPSPSLAQGKLPGLLNGCVFRQKSVRIQLMIQPN
ncbi:MAG: ribbon-helix-helix domain-containing protein [Caldilineaceae bacterium]